jgi:hypothetical protein
VKTSSPLVGSHFRPPAKAIIAVLRNGTPLLIDREPDNAYDPQAVKVSVESAHIPSSQLDELDAQASGFGFSAKDILAQPLWHLGYIAAKPPKGRPGTLATEVSNRLLEGGTANAVLAFDGQGLPEVQIEWGASL